MSKVNDLLDSLAGNDTKKVIARNDSDQPTNRETFGANTDLKPIIQEDGESKVKNYFSMQEDSKVDETEDE